MGKTVSWNKNVLIIYAFSIVTLCKGQTGTLNCSTGSDTIDILDADFGRYDLTTCGNSSTNPHCGTATAWNFIVDKCQSRKICSIIHDRSTEKLLGTPDPCPGVIKYIKVVYQCTGISIVMLNLILVLGTSRLCFFINFFLLKNTWYCDTLHYW